MNQILGVALHENLAPSQAQAEVEGDCRCVLLVEDESFVREVTREILISAGYRVFAAKNANEAVRIYQEDQWQIDLVITDLVLPGESGRSLAAALQRQNPKLKVLFMSGYQNQIELKNPPEPEKDFLMKPFSSSMLLSRIKLMLDRPIIAGDSDDKLMRASDGELLG
ncbi:MAG: response regulator [Candidatus Sulfotelmatobacter sp.]